MAVDDHGLEVLKKAGNEVTSGDQSNYYINTRLTNFDNNNVNLETNDSNQLKVVLDGKVDENNSTSTPLDIDAIFTGTATETLDYAIIFVTVYSDVASATDGLMTQISSDGITWRNSDCYTIPAGIEKTFSFQANKKYFRVMYTNGGIAQSTFDLSTVFKKTNSKPSSHRISDSIINDDDATLVKAVLTGSNPAGDFVNFQATTQGNFKASLEELENTVSVNSNSQLKTTSFDSTGNEGQTIIGSNYIAGKSGIDAITEAMYIIDYNHHEIHAGSHYFRSNVVDLAINEVFDIRITTPNTATWAHIVYKIQCENQTEWIFYEDVAITNAGTSVTPLNNNRNSSNTSAVLLDEITNTSVTNANADTDLTSAIMLADQICGSGRDSGFNTRDNEIILRQNTIYNLRFIATTAGYVDYLIEWYEHVNKN